MKDCMRVQLTGAAARPRRWGFEYGSMINGLWQGPNAVTQDFLTVMYRIQALGFNAVRVPMSFQARAPRTPGPARGRNRTVSCAAASASAGRAPPRLPQEYSSVHRYSPAHKESAALAAWSMSSRSSQSPGGGWGRGGAHTLHSRSLQKSSASCLQARLHARARTGARPPTGAAGRADPVRHVAAELLGVLPAVLAGRCRPQRRAPRRLNTRRQAPAHPGAHPPLESLPFLQRGQGMDSACRDTARLCSRIGPARAPPYTSPPNPPPPTTRLGARGAMGQACR